MAEIVGYGVMSTPGIVIDDIIVHAGGLPTLESVSDWVNN